MAHCNARHGLHTDQLGSVIAITNETGALREQMAYDSWGKRRTLNGAPVNGTPTPDNLDGVTDNKGFTGHEMLDQLDLVHMNGRIYDPLVARMMSADPYIQDPLSSQSYNRYTYVWNNPTNMTDPTGFVAMANTEEAIAERNQKETERLCFAGACFGNITSVSSSGGSEKSAAANGSNDHSAVSPKDGADGKGATGSGGNGSGTKPGCDPGPSCVYVLGKREGRSNLSPADRAVIDGLIKDYPTTPHCRTARCSMTEKIQAFGSGVWSVAKGTGNAVRFFARGTGLMGADEQKRWKQEGDGIQGFVDKYRSDKEFANEVDHAMGQALGKMYINNQDGWLKAFILGRVSTGVITGFGPAAFIGDTTRKVEEGHGAADSLLKGGVLGQ